MIAVQVFCLLSLLLVVGKGIRVGVPLLQKLYLPSAVIGGIVGLIGGPVMMSVLVGAFHSNLQGSTLNDCRLIIRYFRERWK